MDKYSGDLCGWRTAFSLLLSLPAAQISSFLLSSSLKCSQIADIVSLLIALIGNGDVLVVWHSEQRSWSLRGCRKTFKRERCVVLDLRKCVFITAIFLFATFPTLAMALDTYEPILPVNYNIETYLAFEEIGKDELAVSTELALAYGANESLTLTFGVSQSVAVNGLERPNFSTWIGAITNAVDTEIFDMDFLLDFTVGDISKSPQYGINPSFEFNFDADPDMLTWGVYARIGMPIYGEREDEISEGGSGKYHFNMDLSFTLGAYLWWLKTTKSS